MKKKMSRILALALALVMLVACAAPLTSCKGPDECTEHVDADSNGKCDNCDATVTPDGGDGGTTDGKKTYTVTLKTAVGKSLSGVSVFVVDTEDPDFLKHAKTDEKGKATFELAPSTTYAIELDNVPSGYVFDAQYPITSTSTNLTITSALRPDTGLSSVSYSVGDIAYDATLTDPDGNKINFAEILKTKKAIVLNFWYTTCTYCLQEFPYIQAAYEEYGDNIEVIAVNDYADDDNRDVKEFKEAYGYTFPMVKDDAGLYNACGFTVAPCTVVIDRYGMITVMEAGAILGTRYWTNLFEYLESPTYDQKLLESIMELSPAIKPDVEMESSETIAGAINGSDDIVVTYHPETNPDDAEYAWPFVTTTKDGKPCIKPSNTGIDSSYAIIYATVELKAGEALMFDYLSSTQADDNNGYYDTLYVIVDGNDICSIQGADEIEEWKKCCAYVALEDGTYEVGFCYLKDNSEYSGEIEIDDAVYIANMRVVGADEVDVESYIYREAATDVKDDNTGYNSYATIVLGADGYYHVGTADGPLLLAKLIDYTNFEDDNYVSYRLYHLETDRVFNVTVDGKTENRFNHLELYCQYASNASMYGYCPVTPELKMYLERYTELFAYEAGKIPEDNMWLQLCVYYDAYGTDGKQLEDPIKGLTSFSAFDVELSTEDNVVYNDVTYKRVIMPRGYFYKFTPTVSGVYRVLSQSAYEVNGWIFTGSHEEWAQIGDRKILVTSEQAERIVPELLVDKNNDGKVELDTTNCTMLAYLEAGVDYYIDIAFYDVYQFGSFTFTVEYVGESFDMFCMASPDPFTYEINPDGSMGNLIAGGIKVALGDDGYYYHKIGVDSDGNAILGSKIYADFIMTTNVFPSHTMQQLINNGAFDFSKTENDLEAIALLEKYGTDNNYAALRNYWGADFDANWDNYKMDDIILGIYHGRGEDYTAEMQSIYDANIQYTDEDKTDIVYPDGHPELQGCVAVDARLAQILQLLMNKFTFNGVADSWTKLCYYYQYLGAAE